jgi:hypothetical protein
LEARHRIGAEILLKPHLHARAIAIGRDGVEDAASGAVGVSNRRGDGIAVNARGFGDSDAFDHGCADRR